MTNEFEPIIINDYPYFPKSRKSFATGPVKAIIERTYAKRKSAIQDQISFMMAQADSFAKIPFKKVNEQNPFWNNHALPFLDSAMLYSFMAELKPRLYFEIGSGNSTKFAARAIRDKQLRTKIISIDPKPRAEVDAICDVVIRKGLEDVDLAIVDTLSSDDLIIIDNSHRCFPNSDVMIFFCEIMPRLPPGCVFAIHDIALPGELFCERYYNEQYMLAAYLLGGSADEILFPTGYLGQYTTIFDDKIIYSQEGTPLPLKAPAGFFWMRKRR